MIDALNIWSNKLGILPVNFLHQQKKNEKIYALLDGARNNFCLSFNYEIDPSQALNNIWSANMSNFVYVNGEQLYLYNIKTGLNPQKISYDTVLWNLRKFKNYLESISLQEEETIVPFIMNYFRQIRLDLREENSASNSLKIFLYIISQLDDLNIPWKLPDGVEDAKSSLRSSFLLDEVIEQMKKGTIGGLTPNVNMVLRHCAGHLFQEANYVAQFNPQLELFASSNFRMIHSQRQVGSYFTPLYIARSIVEETLRQINAYSKDKLVIFDPACGSGVFLVEALRQLKSSGYQGEVEVIGWDIDPLAKAMADFVLYYEAIEWAPTHIKVQIELKDSLNDYNNWPKSDAVFMNPPFVSWALMNSEQREHVVTIMGKTSINRLNLASLFYLLATQSLKKEGGIGSLMPSSFLITEMAQDIRKMANVNARPTLICNLGGFIFDSVMADVSILIASNKEVNPKTQMVWTKNRVDIASEALQELRRLNEEGNVVSKDPNFNIYITQFDELQKNESWKCLSRESFRLRQKMTTLGRNNGFDSAETIFDIKQGARTGANAVFVVSAEYYQSLPSSEKKFFRPSVDNASIKDGKLSKTNYLFYPYSNDSLLLKDEDSLKHAVPTYYKSHLVKQKEKLSMRCKIGSDKWWVLTRPRNWQFEKKPKMVSTEFGKSGSFAFDKTGEYVVERGLVWIPKKSVFCEKDYYRYIALMNAPFFDCLLELFSNELIGGVYNLETKYVKNIPLPIFDYVEANVNAMLFDYGRQMSSGELIDVNILDGLIRDIYGER